MQKEITGNYQSIGWELERHDATNERRRCDSHCGAGEQHGARATRQPEAALLRANAGCGGWLAGAPSADSGAVSSSWPRLPALGSPVGGLAAAYSGRGSTPRVAEDRSIHIARSSCRCWFPCTGRSAGVGSIRPGNLDCFPKNSIRFS